jgi:uncharacterized protein (DUF4213/DUF364 family)
MRLGKIRIEKAVIGLSFTGVKLSDGSCAVAYTPAEARGVLHHPGPARDRKPPPGRLRGVRVLEVLQTKDADPLTGAIRLAAMSALSAYLLVSGKYRLVADKDALDMLDISRMRKVCLVGAFGTYIQRLKAVPGLKLRVLELNKDAF